MLPLLSLSVKRFRYRVMKVLLSVQCKMARVALGLGVRELGALAEVSPDTIARLERGEALKERTLGAVRSALEVAGIIFVEENGDGPGIRLRHWVHTEQSSSRLLFRKHSAPVPAGKWDAGKPLFKLPQLAKYNDEGWFVLEEPTAEDRERAARWYPEMKK